MSIKQKIPLINIPDSPIIGSTQEHIPVADITNNIVLFKNGGAALLMESTSLNFGLLSEREQEAVVASYAALINSLSFSIQILVRTQKKDVSNYIRLIEEQIPKVKNPKLKMLIEGYKTFISETIKKKNVLGKRFFIIIPFSPFELGLSTKSFLKISKKAPSTLPYSRDYILKKALIALTPKRDHLIRQAARLGLKLRQLTDDEILALYYNVYNPDIEVLKIRKEDEEIKDENTQATPQAQPQSQA
jgi:hypothetical protein